MVQPAGDQQQQAQFASGAAKDKVSTRNLNFWYGSKQALFDVSVDVASCSVTSLIGPSGCGKSTFLRVLNRMCDLITATRHDGAVLLNGQDIFATGLNLAELRRRVGMVFQKSNPFPKTIYDNVAYGRRVGGERNRSEIDGIVEQCLRQANLWDEVKDRLQESALALSGGQQQRLCIARALATKPEVLLMDEPTSALDPKSTKGIEELLNSLKARYTIIIVTHSMQQAARVSDHTVFFYEGRLIESGPTPTLFATPKNKQTQEYITGQFG